MSNESLQDLLADAGGRFKAALYPSLLHLNRPYKANNHNKGGTEPCLCRRCQERREKVKVGKDRIRPVEKASGVIESDCEM